jgi:hypothetical protein
VAPDRSRQVGVDEVIELKLGHGFKKRPRFQRRGALEQ